ncbi:hypothetical protein [Halalkalibaculum sp. DA384]|uniref:hypothetical protein n=1 Tax=Halalkalibaculum sp. DA384 TaxID=3373606 RepID=UPI00375485F3
MAKVKLLYIILITTFIGCSTESTSTEIIDRWPNGAKKKVVKYQGEGENEKLLEEKLYTATGGLFEVVDHINNDTLSFHDLNKPNIDNFPFVGVWQWEKTVIDSAGLVTVRKPNKKTSQGTYMPTIMELDSSMNIIKTTYYDSGKDMQLRKLYSFKDSIYNKFVKSLAHEFNYNLTLINGGRLALIKDYGYETDTTFTTIDQYFNSSSASEFNIKEDTLKIRTSLDSLGIYTNYYTAFTDSSYLNNAK